MDKAIRLAQIIKGPTTPSEKGEGSAKKNPFQHYATAGSTGLHGFETPGAGAGRSNRGLGQTLVYDDNGLPYWVTWRVLDEVLDHGHKTAKAADKKFLKYMKDEVLIDIFEATRMVLDDLGAPDVEERMEYYTYNDDNLSITQDVQIFAIQTGENEWLTAAIFHTGVDARCGFSGPVFGIYDAIFTGDPHSIFYLLDTDEVEWQVSWDTLRNLPHCADSGELGGLWDVLKFDATWGCYVTNRGLSFSFQEYDAHHYKFLSHLPEWWRVVARDKEGCFYQRAEIVFDLDVYLDAHDIKKGEYATLEQVYNGRQLNLSGEPPVSLKEFVAEVVNQHVEGAQYG